MPLLVSAQSIVCVDTSLSTFYPQIEYWKVDLNNCTDSLLEEEGGYQSAFDISIRSDGLLHGYGVDIIFPNDSFLFEDGFVFGGSFFPGYLIFDPQIEGLTCDENGFVYAAGKGITKCSTEWPDSQESYLGDLPPDMQCQGDITYRKGKFYVVATGNKLVQVDMKNPANSQIVMEFPPGTLPIHGLTTVQLDCDSMATYAVGRATSHSEVYFVDFESWTSSLVCDLPGRAFTGAASFTECMLPPCSAFVDLDNDNSSIAFWGNFCQEPFCQPPISVADTDVVILSMTNTLDSMELVLSGMLNGPSEYLETSIGNSNLTVLGSGSGSLKFLNNGTATLADFEAALKSVLYQNGATALAYGMRRVSVTGWSEGVASIVSTADLPLSNDVLQTTAIATMPSCHALQDGSIAVQVTVGTAPFSYQWQLGGTDSLLTGIGAGSYTVTVMDANGCVGQDTFALAEPSQLSASIVNAGASAICGNSGKLVGIASGGTGPYNFNWSNNFFGAININLGPGDYLLTTVDSNNCEATASYTIAMGDTVLVQQAATICDGEAYPWNGQDLAVDTSLCHVITLPNGCDSTTCLSLTVNPSPQAQITQSGSLCNGNAVDLTLAGDFDTAAWSTGSSGPSISVTTPGNYFVTVTNDLGCTAVSGIYVLPGVAFDYSANEPNCFGQSNGSISIQAPSSGTPPYQYSIDSTSFSPSGFFGNLEAGTYWPTVMDAAGCKLTNMEELQEPFPITLDAGPDLMALLNEPVTLTATTNLTIPIVLWQPPDFLDCSTCLSPIATPDNSITYTVTVADANGCEASDTVAITVSEIGAFYIPNAFSPNKDGINDWFTVFSGSSVVRVVSMEIFDRKGGLAFSANDFPPNKDSKGWNGMIGDEAAMSGVFTYKILLEFVNGKEEAVTGTVLLLR
jgi:gliding motility-associated-like protein